MSNILEWAAYLSGPSGIAFWCKGLFDRKYRASETNKVDAEAAKVFTEIAVGLVAPLESRISKLEKENLGLFAYIRTLLAWIQIEVPHKVPPAPPLHLDL